MGEHESARGLGGALILPDHGSYEWDLSRGVQVVGSMVDAGSIGVLSVLGEWADAGDENEGRPGQQIQLLLVEIANLDV